MTSLVSLSRSRSTSSIGRVRRVAPVALVLLLAITAVWVVRSRADAATGDAVSVVVASVPVDGHPTTVLATAAHDPLYINRIDMPFARGCVWLKVRCNPNWVPLTITKAQKLRVEGLPTENGLTVFMAMVSLGTQCFVEFHGHILYTPAAAAADYPDSVGADWTIATPTIYPYSWEAIAAPNYRNTNCPTQ